MLTSHQSQSHPRTIPKEDRSSASDVAILGAGIAQFVECPTERPGAILTRVRVPGAERDYFTRSQHLRLLQTVLRCPYSTRVKSHASTAVRTFKIPNTGSHTIVWTQENNIHTDKNG